jgi:hypothetical protein
MDNLRKTLLGPWFTLKTGMQFCMVSKDSAVLEADISDAFGNNIIPVGDHVQTLKTARQRRVLRLNLGSKVVIAKLFPLKNPSSILRHRKYARREMINYVRAQSAGIDTPQPIAFIEYRKFGFVRMSGLLVEYIDDLEVWHDTTDSDVYYEQAAACIPTLLDLFNKGVNHIDARDENLLRKGSRTVVIDWQYASFVDPKAPWLLEHLTAYFIRNAPEEFRAELRLSWLKKVHEGAALDVPFETFETRVDALLNNRQSVKARLRLRPEKV